MSEDTQTEGQHNEPSLIEILLGLTGCGIFLLGLVYTCIVFISTGFNLMALMVLGFSFTAAIICFALLSLIGRLRRLDQKR